MTDSSLFQRWLRGWVAARGFAATQVEAGIWSVPVEQARRSVEYVVLDSDSNPSRLAPAAALASGANAWVTVATTDRHKCGRALHDAGLRVAGATEWLMSVELARQAERRPTEPYVMTVEHTARSIAVRASLGHALVAGGHMAVVDGDAIADQIETDSEHRRRGLGGAVMTALATEAMRSGAVCGILVASAQGRELYRSLGWTVAAEVLIARPA